MKFSFTSYCIEKYKLSWSIIRRYSIRHWFRQYILSGHFRERIESSFQKNRRPRPKRMCLLPGLCGTNSELHIQAKNAVRDIFKPLEKKYSLDESVIFQHLQFSDFSNTTTVVLSYFGTQHAIEPYIVFLCRQFKQFGWKVILVSPRSITIEGNDLDCVDAILLRTCAGSHFASWKAAFSALPSLFACKKVILCNDSFFGGIGSFATVHQRMQDIACDFWGLTEHYSTVPFLESYYLVFRSSALQHQAFSSFFESVPLSSNQKDDEQCEEMLTLWLAIHGLCPAVYIPSQKHSIHNLSPCIEYWDKLIEWDVPILKCNLPLRKELNMPLFGWMNLVQKKGYPVENTFCYFNQRDIDATIALHANDHICKWPPCVHHFYKSVSDMDNIPNTKGGSSVKKIGVFIHMYYVDIATEVLEYVLNIPKHALIFISTDSIDKKKVIQAACEKIGIAKRTEIQVFPNKGWDIAPFLVGFREALTQFDLLIHLHSKRSLHLHEKHGDVWRQLLYQSLVGNKDQVNKIIDLFSKNDKLGLVCPPVIPSHITFLNAGINFRLMKKLLSEHDVCLEQDTPIDFPVGSMFWCRPQVLKPWLDHQFTFDEFGQSDTSKRDGTLAHALERLFFFGCALEGCFWTRIVPPSIEKSDNEGD